MSPHLPIPAQVYQGSGMGEVFYRNTGVGNPVVCIHGSLGSSRQWQPLTELLQDRYEIFSPDLYGYGKSPAWSGDREMTVDDELDLLAPVFQLANGGLSLIGHSWGGAVAIKAALKYRQKLKSLVLFEPALWSLLTFDAPESSAMREISRIYYRTLHSIEQENWVTAAKDFLDYWVGPDVWEKMTDSQRGETVVGMRAVRNDWHGSFNDPTPLSVFSVIDAPVLLLTGSKSPAAAKYLVGKIGAALKNANIVEIENAGHMGPITHADQVNLVVEEFLDATNP